MNRNLFLRKQPKPSSTFFPSHFKLPSRFLHILSFCLLHIVISLLAPYCCLLVCSIFLSPYLFHILVSSFVPYSCLLVCLILMSLVWNSTSPNQSTLWTTSFTPSSVYTLNNLISLHTFSMSKPSKWAFINPFIYFIPRTSLSRAFGIPFSLLISKKPL